MFMWQRMLQFGSNSRIQRQRDADKSFKICFVTGTCVSDLSFCTSRCVFFFFLLFFIDLCSVHCIYGIIWFDGREHSKKLYKVLYNDVVELTMFNEKNISVSIWSFQYEF